MGAMSPQPHIRSGLSGVNEPSCAAMRQLAAAWPESNRVERMAYSYSRAAVFAANIFGMDVNRPAMFRRYLRLAALYLFLWAISNLPRRSTHLPRRYGRS